MMQTELGKVIRECLEGEPPIKERYSVFYRWGKKLRYWQELAQKYQGVGLSREEVERLLGEMREKKTQTDLILELTVRSEDLKDASSEVRVFMDRLMEDLAVKTPEKRLLGKSKLAHKKVGQVKSGKKKRVKPRRKQFEEWLLAASQEAGKKKNQWWKTDMTEILETALELKRVREGLNEEEVALLTERPELLLGYIREYLQGGITRALARGKGPFETMKIRIFGVD